MNFRKTILAMAMLAVFAGLASAQVIVGGNTGVTAGPLTCTANVAVPNQLRSEGITELIGDIVLTCTGGAPLAVGSVIPTANITVSLATQVTSRLLACSGAGGTGAGSCSEAVLLIDEPNTNATGAAGAGPQATFTPCNFPQGAGANGCLQQVAPSGQSQSCAAAGGSGITCTTTVGPAANVFSGIVAANQVIFNGVPVNPPSTGGFARVYRIANVRANASALGGGGLPGTTQLLASISISGSTALPIANPVQIAGFIQQGLTSQLRSANNLESAGNQALPQCGGGGPTALRVLRFTEGFASSFKTRTAPTATSGGQNNNANQTVPGTIYNSESGLMIPALNAQVGVADFGTRLKAVFNNIPAGVRIFVSTTNVRNDFFNPVVAPPAPNSTDSFAVLNASETGGFSPVTGGTPITIGSTIFASSIQELSVVNGTASAVWEVINTNPTAIEGTSTTATGSTTVTNPNTFDFGVWQAFTPNPGANTPPVGQATVNMSFAPTGTVASPLVIPRFADTSTATNIFSIALCQTALLFPFVTNTNGFDTGLAIANTTTDPFGTRTQNGSCTLSFFGTSPPPAVNTGNIATGTVYVDLASAKAAGFQGYMIALCNFQLAHGFAFISDIGARNLAMGYLALVLPTTAGNRNNAAVEGLNN